MLIFGVDVPLIEILLAMSIITFLMLLEAIILVILLVKMWKKEKNK